MLNHRPRIQFIAPFLDGDYYGKIFSTIYTEAKQRGFDLVVIQSMLFFPQQFPLPHRIGLEETDGWLLMTNPNSPLPLAPELLQAIGDSGEPVVTIGYRELAIPSHTVAADNRKAAFEAVAHLIREHGHRRIAYVGSKEHVDLIERFEGYKDALAAYDIPFDESLAYFMADALQPAGHQAAEDILSRNSACTAIFAATDNIAIGLMETLQAKGKRIPQDYAVIGFDDIPSACELTPPLTTVRQSFTQMALSCMNRLDQLMQGQTFSSYIDELPTTLMLRQSCGCPSISAHAPEVNTSRELLRVQSALDIAVKDHYRFSNIWGTAIRNESFQLEQMFGDEYHTGLLVLWDEDDPDHQRLRVHQGYSRKGHPLPVNGTLVKIEQFPSSSWFAELEQNEYIHVHAIRSRQKDWGFIVIIRTIDKFYLTAATDFSHTGFTIALAALERDNLNRQIQFLAYHDSLTRLANRQYFTEHVQTCIAYADKHGTKIGFLLLDLDKFKSVNDALGHRAGDELLRQTAAILNEIVQQHEQHKTASAPRNIAARLGGDEFILLLNHLESESALCEAAERIRQHFATPFNLLGEEVTAACSIGFAIYPNDGHNFDTLAHRADIRMYQDKRTKNESR